MKEFNLQDALDGAKVVTRDGRDVKIVGYDVKQQEPVIGWVDGIAAGWDMNGHFNNPCENDADLFMALVERKEWVVRVAYSDNDFTVHGPYNVLLKAQSFLESIHGVYATIHEITIID